MKRRTRYRAQLIIIVLGFLALVVIADEIGLKNHP